MASTAGTANRQPPASPRSGTDLSRSLQEILGPRLTAIVAGVDDVATLRRWAGGQPVPGQAMARLCTALEAAETLLTVESRATVRAWFVGMNAVLDDTSPALAIASDPDRVLLAARVFAAYG